MKAKKGASASLCWLLLLVLLPSVYSQVTATCFCARGVCDSTACEIECRQQGYTNGNCVLRTSECQCIQNVAVKTESPPSSHQ
ncbi:unnamed protein product [Spirodela intermedia]|uniref:Uncharacterized protein n=1 Tax=Spirodela intermedia TaxID=51605 RepID=A0A7I8IJ57_SPIIN|nr:unnamed protein product [Spirodela intermedia]CAA6657929.1 unnamed protein product [Spirodela intermedia]